MAPPDVFLIHPTLFSAVGLCRARQSPGHPRTLCRVSATLTPDSHQRGLLQAPTQRPRGLHLGVAGPFGSCPELLVTSYLLPWNWVCCWAGQRKVTRPSLGVSACQPPQDTSWVLPKPTPTHFRGHLASPALQGKVGRVTAYTEALFPSALFFQLPVSMALPERVVSATEQRRGYSSQP